MVQAQIQGELNLMMDEDDPIEGNLKIKKGTLLTLDNADALTQFSVHSGVGVTIESDTLQVYEGVGSIKITIPQGITAIVKCTKSAGSWDLSSYKYFRATLRRDFPYVNNVTLYMGEAAYDEENSGAKTIYTDWGTVAWDISGIAAGDRDAVTIFAIECTHSGGAGTSPGHIWVDFIFGDPGPGKGMLHDGDRAASFYPKVYASNYIGTGIGNTQIVTFERKGTPDSIEIIAEGKVTYRWITGMGSDTCMKFVAAGDCQWEAVNNILYDIAEGTFTVTANLNTNLLVYFFEVRWND